MPIEVSTLFVTMLHDITILLYFDVINATYHDRAPKAPWLTPYFWTVV